MLLYPREFYGKIDTGVLSNLLICRSHNTSLRIPQNVPCREASLASVWLVHRVPLMNVSWEHEGVLVPRGSVLYPQQGALWTMQQKGSSAHSSFGKVFLAAAGSGLGRGRGTEEGLHGVKSWPRWGLGRELQEESPGERNIKPGFTFVCFTLKHS